jgi:hypothetical protein
MVDIVALLQWTRPHVTAATVRQLSRIIVAMVAMTGRVTMGGLARWAGKGGSYRTAIPGQKSASNMLDQWNFGTMPLSLPVKARVVGG